MKRSTLFWIAGLGLLFTGFAGTKQQDDPKGVTCITCHPNILRGKVRHQAAERKCEVCHQANGKEHPDREIGFSLVAGVPELCIGCHEETSPKKSMHAPAVTGKCLACHSPHSSAAKKLIKDNSKVVCLSCHSVPIREGNRTIANISALTASGKIVHPAVENGGCTICHNGHNSDFQHLLNASYPAGLYFEARVDSAELCFNCHDTDLLEKELTTSTGFRNGDQNLHFIHMSGGKARSCSICHNPHGSTAPHLMNDRVPFGSSEIRIGYQDAENGGNCSTGCHIQRSYTR